jgi:hypothetical protein
MEESRDAGYRRLWAYSRSLDGEDGGWGMMGPIYLPIYVGT